MRDTKSLSLLLLSSVLFLLSIILLCTWGYQYYHQIQQDNTKVPFAATAAPSTVPDATRDSLLKIYKVTLNTLDNRLDTAWYYTDSLKGNLDINLREFYTLRDEIAAMLQDKSANVDLNLARKKIGELQQKVQMLRYRNSDVENENKRLKAILEQLGKETQGIQQNSKQVEQENKNLADKVSAMTTISTVNLSLAALANNDQQETAVAGQAEKLVGSFTVKNTGNNYSKCDIIIVVLQPDGQVLQKSAWESGSFETTEGRKVYSCKVRCETTKGESKKLNFSITADNYQKGNYTLQIYHNGIMIGKASKVLS
jgi:hypothetical protein